MDTDIVCFAKVNDARFYQRYLTADLENGDTCFYGEAWQCFRAGNQFVAMANRGDGRFDLRLLKHEYHEVDMHRVRVHLVGGERWRYSLVWPGGGRVGTVVDV